MLETIDRWQRRRRWLGFAVGVAKRYVEDGAVRHGARIAYYAFFSVFPLMLAFVSILGFVLEDNAELRQDILDSTYADMPVVGPFIRSDIDAIGGSGHRARDRDRRRAVGGPRHHARARAGDGPRVERPAGRAARLGRAPGTGARDAAGRRPGLLASSVLGGVAASGELGAGARDRRVVPALARRRCAGPALRLPAADGGRPRLRELLPGVALAAVGLLVLQALGGRYVEATIGRATDTYGLFATVIGLLSWLSLAAQLILIAAELNAVAGLRLWPRSLTGPLTAADRRALEGYARAAMHDERATISVELGAGGRHALTPGARARTPSSRAAYSRAIIATASRSRST